MYRLTDEDFLSHTFVTFLQLFLESDFILQPEWFKTTVTLGLLEGLYCEGNIKLSNKGKLLAI